MKFEPTIEVNPDILIQRVNGFVSELFNYKRDAIILYEEKTKTTIDNDRKRIVEVERKHHYQDHSFTVSAVAEKSFFFPVLDEASFRKEIAESLDYLFWLRIDGLCQRIESELQVAKALLVDLHLVSSYSKSMEVKLPELRQFEQMMARISDISTKFAEYSTTAENESANIIPTLS